ncbi:MAG: 30S ribosomal protein S11 [Bdellovibrionales bacterium]|nr:30S ribosomal protein S11 [Bdellovibrionales bacterium]
MATETNTNKADQKNKPVKKKTKKNVPVGKCFVQAGFGNTIITITDPSGNTVSWSSSGMLGFKGSRKGTPFASQLAAEDAAKKAIEQGVKSVDVLLNGPGAGREPAIRALANAGLRVTSMRDITPVPHNGCRPPKRRRV